MKVYGKVNGSFGTNVSVQKSTLAPLSAWLFVRNSENGPVKGAMHLNRDQAKELYSSLAEFLGDW